MTIDIVIIYCCVVFLVSKEKTNQFIIQELNCDDRSIFFFHLKKEGRKKGVEVSKDTPLRSLARSLARAPSVSFSFLFCFLDKKPNGFLGCYGLRLTMITAATSKEIEINPIGGGGAENVCCVFPTDVDL
jgi:hypothetical protein